MTEGELIEKLNTHLNEINEILSLADLGLLKSEELDSTKRKIEDALESYKPLFNRIEALKIEKTIPKWKLAPKSGIFLNSHKVNPQLQPLHVLLQELINAKGGPEHVTPVPVPQLKITGTTINRAIEDSKVLLSSQGATSALDRIHTVLHGYLKQVCNDAGLRYSEDDSFNQLVKILKSNHPALATMNDNTEQILKSFANVLDKLNSIRNSSSLAHANTNLLPPDEAMFVINSVNTILSFLNNKFK